MKNVLEVIGSILFLVFVVVLFWLYLIVTPDQYSAECEALRMEMQEEGLTD